MDIAICRCWDLSDKEKQSIPNGGSQGTYYLRISWEDGEEEVVPVRSRAVEALVLKAYEKGRYDGYESGRRDGAADEASQRDFHDSFS